MTYLFRHLLKIHIKRRHYPKIYDTICTYSKCWLYRGNTMFCPHCGAQHSGVGTFCVTCGKQGNPIAQVNAKIYPHCPHCGNPGVVDRFMIGRSVTCPRCNSIFIVTDPAPQANQQMPSAQYINIQMNAQPGIAYNPKDKTTAILLAIFLGIFAWLYTYRCLLEVLVKHRSDNRHLRFIRHCRICVGHH